MTSRIFSFAAALAATAFLAGGAHAQAEATDAPAQEASVSQDTSDSPDAPFAADKAASTEILNRSTAREDISQVATSTQNSTVSGNSVSGTSTTGTVGFSDNAFQNASGLTVINANSGNNVSMNASMNVNIVMTPATPQQ
jgi:hypothetical protein